MLHRSFTSCARPRPTGGRRGDDAGCFTEGGDFRLAVKRRGSLSKRMLPRGAASVKWAAIAVSEVAMGRKWRFSCLGTGLGASRTRRRSLHRQGGRLGRWPLADACNPNELRGLRAWRSSVGDFTPRISVSDR